MKLGACLLAAGASERMGRSKALLPFEGRTFLAAALEMFRAAGVETRFVVGRATPAPELAAMAGICAANGARLLVNPEPERGMLSSLHVCLNAMQSGDAPALAGLFVLPVDCPGVRPGTLAALAAAFRTSGAPVVVPRFGLRRGHPVLFAAALFEELAAAPLDQGARAVVRAHAADRLELPVDDPAVLNDVDTPDAIARLRRALPRDATPPSPPANPSSSAR